MPSGGKRIGWAELAAADVRGARVLIVDDDEALRRALQKTVSSFGYSVTLASSAEQADGLVASNNYDVALLDVDLPRMSGVEFLRWALSRDPELPVIMLTGLDSIDLAIECLRAGARAYFVKPPEPDFIREALRDAVTVRRLLVGHNDRAERES